MSSTEARARLRPDVEAEPAVRNVVVPRDPALRVGVERRRGDDVGGQLDGERERRSLAELLGHLASDDHGVGPVTEVLEDAELVLDLGAARDEDERSLDVAEQPAEALELGHEQQPGVRGQEVRDRLGRGVRAMRGAERVVHVEVHALGEGAGRLRVVRGLPREEARVLEDAHPLVRDELGQPLGDGRDRERRVGAFRAPEVRAHRDLGRVALEQQLERRERCADSRVVRDAAVVERDVEVGADEDALAGDVGGLDGPRQPHPSSFPTRSTRRQL